jgi:hypothetical protein
VGLLGVAVCSYAGLLFATRALRVQEIRALLNR